MHAGGAACDIRRSMPRVLAWLACAALTVPGVGRAFTADLVPASPRPEAAEITGRVTIGGADGTVHVSIQNVNDAAGDPLDSTALLVQVKMRVNGARRRFAFSLLVDGGDGETQTTLGLAPGDRVIVQDVRVRGLGHRTIAEAGILAAAEPPSPPPTLPPPPDQCPAALAACQSDLDDCNVELDDCQLGN